MALNNLDAVNGFSGPLLSREGREKCVKIFPPCERARGVVFGGPEVVIFPPAGRLASRRASDPPPGGGLA